MTENIVELQAISKSYATRRGLFGRRVPVRAVDEVSLSLAKGQTLALVGESGSGKSTTGRVALGLERADTGCVLFRGTELPAADTRAWRRMRAQMQMIYQDPLAALDRRLTVLDQVREPLDIHEIGSASERNDKALAMLGAVGLNASHAGSLPSELSGGQRQRAVLARALIMRPELLICDEPVSALDVSIQAQVVNLLMDLQKEMHLSILFISHDLKVVRQISQRMAVMYLGRIVECGDTKDLLANPAHPYTKALVSAVPVAGGRTRERIILTGEPPNPAARPTGCAFHPRCPVARPQCASVSPAVTTLSNGRSVACHAVEIAPTFMGAEA
ncbi:ABC transporter ATP-binding protein [Mesorhizobium waimense]|uniref:ABC transporter ATP-binding protein n=1 Tax=Mesorhizobium waimense TaxID=1300307 RepID=A0A3A5JU71_9HYPH|nr:ABC transporter ATP-binding protein [Mesorhizobium waimense]RJT26312.1 ABC transporter ATP-binding protein [Mesorhizobium waimense]